MNIAIIGYGKMGKTIERFAVNRGHKIIIKIDKDNVSDLYSPEFKKADVAIEFTGPETAADNYLACFKAGVPVVSGTTGWTGRMDEIKKACTDAGGAFLYASNFSMGVNIFFHVNKILAKVMGSLPDYDVSIEEIHHIHKIDAPSGTAITLAQDIIEANNEKDKWALNEEGDKTLCIDAVREGEVPGTHIVTYESDVDVIKFSHRAKSREGFALGAVVAAEYLNGKKGIYDMNDVLDFK